MQDLTYGIPKRLASSCIMVVFPVPVSPTNKAASSFTIQEANVSIKRRTEGCKETVESDLECK